MRNDHIGKTTHQTGDLNLAASLMACGVPLSQDAPVALIQPEHGKRYGSFRFGPMTADGIDSTDAMLHAWSGRGGLQPGHPFLQLMEFCKAHRAAGIRDTDSLLGFALGYLLERQQSVDTVARISDIPQFIASNRKTLAGFILAYVFNRDVLFKAFSKARTDYYFSKNGHSAMVSDNLPRWQQRELTSRLND